MSLAETEPEMEVRGEVFQTWSCLMARLEVSWRNILEASDGSDPATAQPGGAVASLERLQIVEG